MRGKDRGRGRREEGGGSIVEGRGEERGEERGGGRRGEEREGGRRGEGEGSGIGGARSDEGGEG